MPKQELLDDLIWLYYRGQELGVAIPTALQAKLRNHAEDLLTELYRDILLDKNGKPSRFLSLDYYHSWQLRGDDPYLYYETARSGKIGSGRWGDIFQPFGRNRFQDHISELEHCRNNMDAVELYAAYQYSNAVKIAGQKVAHFEITEDYIYFIRQIQLKMRLYIEKVGLSIECNPSSNTLIGAFGEYRNHPILRFYHPRDKENRGARLHVSLNTDDQGVFETSLSFEYILIAATLAAEIETDGNPVYTNREIEDYLRDLQRMGNEQVFTDFTVENKAKPHTTADAVFQE